MEIIKPNKFLDYFPNHVFRFIDQTGEGRSAVSSAKYDRELNTNGYEAYFTVNGFGNFATDGDCKREHLTNLNAFFVDIDGRKDIAELEAIRAKLEPTFILETMRGYHIYWSLDEVIYKDEIEETAWNDTITKWEAVEQALVTTLKADKAVKDAPRILRIPGTYYWKKSGEAYRKGVSNAPFKIRILHSDLAKRYSIKEMQEAFPPVKDESPQNRAHEIAKNKTESERKDFFAKVNKHYPITDRPSFKALVSGAPSSIPHDDASRNVALLVTASLAREAGMEDTELYNMIVSSGWHGMVAERGGKAEIKTTIDSAYNGGYTFGKNNAYIEWNTTEEERKKLQDAYTAVMKDRREADKVRYSTYEHEIHARYPYLKKNTAGVIFNYVNGVYRMVSDPEMEKIILDAMYDDHLWGYRTGRCVSDKVMCLISILPLMVESFDNGQILNVANGLLDIITHEFKPHDPNFVSLVQIPITYDPEATCPNWQASIRAWTEGEEEMQKSTILKQYAGYCLSSSMKHGKALFLVGDGGNGKSTYADTIAMLMGEDSTESLSLDDLGQPFGLATLIGKRLNIVEEVSSNYMHSNILKKLVSGEVVTASIKYKSSFKFRAQAKFIFAVNTMPRVDDSSFGTERRILIVNFKNNFRDRPDTDLRFSGGKLAQELPGILNWALEGAKDLHEKGKFLETDEHRETIQEYREENSSVDGFLAECLVEKEGSVIETDDLYEVYTAFCKRDGRKAKSKIQFSKELKMSRNKKMRFSFVVRAHGSDTAKVEGLKLNDKWERNFESSYAPQRYF